MKVARSMTLLKENILRFIFVVCKKPHKILLIFQRMDMLEISFGREVYFIKLLPIDLIHSYYLRHHGDRYQPRKMPVPIT